MSIYNRLFLFVAIGYLYSYAEQSINEQELFSDTNAIFHDTTVVNNTIVSAPQQKTTGISGQIISAGLFQSNRTFFGDTGYKLSQTRYGASITGTLLFDIRLLNNVKGFTNIEMSYNADTGIAQYYLRESFLDVILGKRVYLRTGKQVLQWGICAFWNPTDLINVEKNSFFQKIGSREGTYGVKMHVPFGTAINLYGFLDMNGVRRIDECAGAGKAEFLIGNTEIALAAWNRPHRVPVFGLDISKRLLTVDISGEMSISNGDNNYSMDEQNGILSIIKKRDIWIPRVSLNLHKSYGFMNVSDRISISTEFYYNHAGYIQNILEDDRIYRFNEPIIKMVNGLPVPQFFGKKSDYFLYNNLYEMHSYSRFYAAAFASCSKFIISDMTLFCNGIVNVKQKSGLLSTGVTYTNVISNLSSGLTINGYIGPSSTEYTAFNNALSVQLTVGISF